MSRVGGAPADQPPGCVCGGVGWGARSTQGWTGVAPNESSLTISPEAPRLLYRIAVPRLLRFDMAEPLELGSTLMGAGGGSGVD